MTEAEREVLDQIAAVARSLPRPTLAAVCEALERLQLNPGDRIVLATDGVTEAESLNGDFFGEDRLEAALEGCTIEAVLNKVESFMAGAPPNDDFTMLEILYSA